MEWSKALSLLKEGNKRFVENSLTNHKDCLVTARERNALKQKPFAVILSCADSRVVPELAFDVGIGELFVIRVAGNVANKHTIASIEYAVAILDVNIIVVMGHESCGAITAAMQGKDMESKNLNYLISYTLLLVLFVIAYPKLREFVLNSRNPGPRRVWMGGSELQGLAQFRWLRWLR